MQNLTRTHTTHSLSRHITHFGIHVSACSVRFPPLICDDILRHCSNSTIRNKPSPEELLPQLEERWKQRNKLKPIKDETQLLELLAYLLEVKTIHPRPLLQVLTAKPSIMNHTLERWFEMMDVMSNHGFRPLQALNLLADHPDLWTRKAEYFVSIMETLRGLGFQDGNLQQFMVRCRPVFQLSPQDINMCFVTLLKAFSRDDCLHIIDKNPAIFAFPAEDVEEKYLYVINEMGIEDDSIIAKSHLFSRSVLDIHTRHVFLVRAGLYEKPNKRGETKIQNPSLSDIIDLNDSEFAQKVGGMTEEEFLAFQELYAREIADDNEVSDDGDAEGDEDDDEYDDSEEEEDRKSYHKRPHKS